MEERKDTSSLDRLAVDDYKYFEAVWKQTF